MKRKLSREELIDLIASNHGYGPEITEQFTTDELRKAYNSPQGAYNYIKVLLEFRKPKRIDHYIVHTAKLSDRAYNLFPIEKEEEKENAPNNWFTILIGANGTGKSFCLSKLSEVLRYCHNKSTGKKKPKNYSIQTSYGKNQYTIYAGETYGQKLLPNRVITLSHSLFDKFSPATKSDKDFYYYIGARDSGIYSERYCTYDFLDTIQENIENKDFRNKLSDLFNYLGLEAKIDFGLKPRYTSQSELYHKLFGGNIKKEEILDAFNLRFSKISGSQRNYANNLLSNGEFLNGFYEFIQRYKNKLYTSDKESQLVTFGVNLLDTEGLSIKRDLKFITLLRKTNVLSYDSVNIHKSDLQINYDILDSSSGEVNMLTSFGRLIPCLKNHSLFLIDEPEISLHPNWQMDYLKTLRNVLTGFSGCHVIVATHSPFIVSEADPKDCIVVEAKLNEYSEFIDPTYGWTTDDILTKVFGVKSVRSYEFEQLLRELYSKMAKPNENKSRIEFLIAEIEKYNIPKLDPVHGMITHARNKLSNGFRSNE